MCKWLASDQKTILGYALHLGNGTTKHSLNLTLKS